MNRNLIILGLLAVAAGANAQSFFEGFEGCATPGTTAAIAPLPGWNVLNNSTSPGTHGGWFAQNALGPFTANTGNNYAASNWSSVSTGTGTNDCWLMTPVRTLKNGDKLSFWTRTVSTVSFPDRMNVKMSLSGASSAIAAFTVNLLTINPSLTTTGYPNVWTNFTVTVSGLGGPTSGRFAFNYNVTNGGPSGANSDFIGLDDVNYTAVPEPATMAALGLGVAALVRRRRNSK